MALSILGSCLLVLGAVVVALMFSPPRVPSLGKAPVPRLDFDDARALALSEQKRWPEEVNPVCRATLLDHGRRTQRVIVLYHGLSNCPAQYGKLAAELHAMGHNVLVPRMPFHGFTDRLTPDYGRLDLAGLAAWVRESLDVASGLGETIYVSGLSVNGVTAAWIAMERPDVRRAVVVAPFFEPPGFPEWATGPVANLLSRAPNVFLWWNAELKENNPGPPHAYPRFPTRVLAEFMVVGQAVLAMARERPPASPQVAVVTSEADTAISLPAVATLERLWKGRLGENFFAYSFPKAEGVPHDLIDPLQPEERIEASYPILLKLLGGSDTLP